MKVWVTVNTQINHDICQFGNPFPGWGQTQKFGNKGNNKITELRTILQRESQIS